MNNLRSLGTAVIALAACVCAMGPLAGCDPVKSSNSYYYNEPYQYDYSGGSFGGNRYGSIPSSARRVASHTGQIEYTVPYNGTIWVGGDDSQSVVVERGVSEGDLVEVIPNGNRVKINGSVVSTKELNSKAQHSIYFRESGHSSNSSHHYDTIPSNASQVAHGKGRFTWRARSNGFIWVGDNQSRKTITDHKVYDGDSIEVNPSDGRIYINGESVERTTLNSSHDRGIYFRSGN